MVLVGTLILSGRGEHGHYRIERRAEPRGGGRRAAGLVPPPAPEVRNHLAHHQPDRGLQLLTIIISRGDVYMLGEAYAFGVVWSFAMKALSVLVLRYKQPGGREWKVPLNFHVGKTEIPVGLAMITVTLFALAIINVLTKKVATISGSSFTIAFFITFELSEVYNRSAQAGPAAGDGEVPSGRPRGPFGGHHERAARQRAGGGAQSPPPAAPGSGFWRRPIRAGWISWRSRWDG